MPDAPNALPPAIARPQGPPPLDAQPLPAGAPGAGGHPAELLALLLKHRWLALGALAAVAGPTLLWTLLQTPVYLAETRLLLGEETSPVPAIARQDGALVDRTVRTGIETQVELLQSRALARRVVLALRLHQNEQFLTPVPSPLSVAAVARLFSGTPVHSAERDGPPPAGDALATEDVPGSAVDTLLAHLIVAPLFQTRLVDVKYESPDPVLAANIVNTLAEQFIALDLETRTSSTTGAATWLEARLEEQRQRVADAEAALQAFKEQQDALSVEDRQNIVVQRLADLNAAVTRAKTERLAKEQVWNQVEAVRSDRQALDATPVIMQNALVQQLKSQVADLQQQRAQLAERLGERHPDMVRVSAALAAAQSRLDSEINKTVEALRTDYQTAVAQERSLTSALNQQKAAALDLNRKSLEYGALEREALSHRQVYEALMQQAKQTGLAGEFRGSPIQVVDPAEVPTVPVRPDRGRMALFGLFAAVMCAIGLVFTREYLDRHLKVPDDIRQHLGVAYLGLIPELPAGDEAYPLIDAPATSPGFGEAVRRLRGNLLLGVPGPGTRVVLVTSSAPREGKSLVAANLAVALAGGDERVLLVDADLRRPVLHQVFKVRRDPGLSSVLAGRLTPPRAAVGATSVDRLSLLPAGPVPPNPSELLGRDRFRQLLERLASDYDWIVVDSAPVMAVADVLTIAADVSAVLFVTCANLTRRDVAQEALRQLRAARALVAGAVLNRVPLDRQPAYYSRYYNRGYEAYYTRTT